MNNTDVEGRKRATLNNANDDDYEPVRPMMETSEFVEDTYYDEDPTTHSRKNV